MYIISILCVNPPFKCNPPAPLWTHLEVPDGLHLKLAVWGAAAEQSPGQQLAVQALELVLPLQPPEQGQGRVQRLEVTLLEHILPGSALFIHGTVVPELSSIVQ